VTRPSAVPPPVTAVLDASSRWLPARLGEAEELLREAEKVLVENKVVKEGDIIVLTIGEPIGKSGGTNTMKIVKVGEHRKS